MFTYRQTRYSHRFRKGLQIDQESLVQILLLALPAFLRTFRCLQLHIDPLKILPLCNIITSEYYLCVVVLFNRPCVVFLAHGYAGQHAGVKIMTSRSGAYY